MLYQSEIRIGALSSVHIELLAIAMQNWVENFAKAWVEYPFLAMPDNVNSIAYAQCERTLRLGILLNKSKFNCLK